MQKKLVLVFAVFTIGLFVSSYALGDVTVEGIYFSTYLHEEDVIKWHVVYTINPTSGMEIIVEMPNDSDITLTIKQSLNEVNFIDVPVSNFTDYFELKYGNITETFDIDSLYLFLMPVQIRFSNGTEINPCEEKWIYWTLDDFFYASEENRNIEITKKNNIVTYDAWIIYPEDDLKVTFLGKIDTKTGIMQFMNVNAFINSNNTELISMVYENILQPKVSGLSFSWGYAFISLLILPVIFRLKRK
ncbi:MAG: hypothetical protein ACTSUF_06320 [Candidatus Heimdallarchaeaceae archaeon]